MKFIRKIIYMFRLFLLRRALKKGKRKKRVVGYDNAETIVLLYELMPDGGHRFLSSLVKQLEADGKKVYAFGFYQKNTPKESLQEGPGESMSARDFSLFLKPRNEAVKSMLTDKHVDILLDLTSGHAIQMKFLATLFPAFYKVGASHPDFLDVYDLILEVGEECSPKELASHAIHYLKIIKTPA